MNDTLKVAGRIGAELGAAKAEIEVLREQVKVLQSDANSWQSGYDKGRHDGARHRKSEVQQLRGLLRQATELIKEQDARLDVDMLPAGRALMKDIRDALSQQPEPTDAFTAVDMATAAAQGFRDGQAAVEQAPAPDEREAPVVVATAILGGIYHGGSGPELGEIDIDVCMPALEALQCETVNSSDDVFLPLMSVTQHERIVAALTRPAQTEQQPSTDALINGAKALLALDESGSLAPHGIGGLAREVIEKLIVRVEQTAPQPEQSGLVEMVDRAMVEMRNIHPPMRRSDCERLIRAALSAQGAGDASA